MNMASALYRRCSRRAWLGTVLLAAGSVARPAYAQGNPPPEVSAELPRARLIGQARMRFFGFDVYDARLWAGPDFRGSLFAEHALALELVYLRALDGKAIASRSLKEMRRSGPIPDAHAQRWLQAMESSFPDVQSGDRITGMHTPGVGARFWFNGLLRGTIADADFSRLFFGIWLSDATSEPALRSALLGGATP